MHVAAAADIVVVVPQLIVRRSFSAVLTAAMEYKQPHIYLLVVLAIVTCQALRPADAYDWKWKQGRATYYGQLRTLKLVKHTSCSCTMSDTGN